MQNRKAKLKLLTLVVWRWMQIFESFGKRNENKTKNAQGVVIMARASRICKFVGNRMLRVL